MGKDHKDEKASSSRSRSRSSSNVRIEKELKKRRDELKGIYEREKHKNKKSRFVDSRPVHSDGRKYSANGFSRPRKTRSSPKRDKKPRVECKCLNCLM